jgi:hypothetical protein
MAMVIPHMEMAAICSQGSSILCKGAIVQGRKPRLSLVGMIGSVPANADPLPLNPGELHPRPDLSQQWPLAPPMLQNKRQYSPRHIVRMTLTVSMIKTKLARIKGFKEQGT